MNIYYSPEKFGVKIVAEYDPSEPYEFDTTLIFEKEDGSLWWAHDSGCSCPVPFEDVGADDLAPYRYDEMVAHLREQYDRSVRGSDLVDFISKLPR
jgi:hypothetical protein